MRIAALLFLLTAALQAQNPNTAKYPAAVATDNDLLVATNNARTTLSAAVNATTTTIPMVADVFNLPAAITIDAEILLCTSKAGLNYTCARGFDGSAASAHGLQSAVHGYVTAWHHNQTAAELKALETNTFGTYSVRKYGAVGDGSANDTAFVQAAAQAAADAGGVLVFPQGTYAVCTVNVTSTGAIVWRGPGHIVRHASCVNQNSNMFNPSAASIDIDGLYFDMKETATTATTIPYPGSILNFNNQSNIRIVRNYFTGANSVAVQCTACSNVTHVGNVYYQNGWVGLSVASGGTVSSPLYSTGGTSTGNLYIQTSIGMQLNFYTRDWAVSNETYINSNISFTQTPSVHTSVSDVTIDGSSTFGYTAQQGNGVFLEGVSDADIGPVYIRNVSQRGLWCGGSNVTIGTNVQLPCNRLTLHDIHVDNVQNDVPFLITAAATDGTLGTQISVKNTSVTNSRTCQSINSVAGLDMSGNVCDSTQVGGYSFGNIQNFSIRSNRGHNLGMASPGSYQGMLINGTLTANGNVRFNEIENESPYAVQFCYRDDTLAGGNASTIRSWGNTCRNGTFWYPTPAIPTTGNWIAGDRIQTTGSLSGWENTASGTPGGWKALSGTDYAPSTSGTAILKGNGAGGTTSAAAGTDYAPATSGTSILKGNGAGGTASATAGTDYAPATSGTAILKGNGAGGTASATAGTDYAPAISGTKILTGNGSGGASTPAPVIFSGPYTNVSASGSYTSPVGSNHLYLVSAHVHIISTNNAGTLNASYTCLAPDTGIGSGQSFNTSIASGLDGDRLGTCLLGPGAALSWSTTATSLTGTTYEVQIILIELGSQI